MLGLCFCARAFSSCGKRGPLFIAVRGPLTIAAYLVVEHRLQTRRLSSCGSRAQLLHGMWDLPRPGLEPVSPALAGRFSTTTPPAKPPLSFLLSFIQKGREQDEYKHLCGDWIHSYRLLPPGRAPELDLLFLSHRLPAHGGWQPPHCGAGLSWCCPPDPLVLLPSKPLSPGDWLHVRHQPPTASPPPHGSAPQPSLWLCSPDAMECCLLAAMACDRYAAICKFLRFPLLLSYRMCLCLAGSAWGCGAMVGLGHTSFIFSLPFCGPSAIPHFLCEIQAVLQLVWGDTSLNELQIILATAFLILCPFGLILGSYGSILATIFRIPSAAGRPKAFSTSSSHLVWSPSSMALRSLSTSALRPAMIPSLTLLSPSSML